MLRNGIGTAFLFLLISWTNIFAQSPTMYLSPYLSQV